MKFCLALLTRLIQKLFENTMANYAANITTKYVKSSLEAKNKLVKLQGKCKKLKATNSKKYRRL